MEILCLVCKVTCSDLAYLRLRPQRTNYSMNKSCLQQSDKLRVLISILHIPNIFVVSIISSIIVPSGILMGYIFIRRNVDKLFPSNSKSSQFTTLSYCSAFNKNFQIMHNHIQCSPSWEIQPSRIILLFVPELTAAICADSHRLDSAKHIRA